LVLLYHHVSIGFTEKEFFPCLGKQEDSYYLARIEDYRWSGKDSRYDLDMGRFWIPDNSRIIADIVA